MLTMLERGGRRTYCGISMLLSAALVIGGVGTRDGTSSRERRMRGNAICHAVVLRIGSGARCLKLTTMMTDFSRDRPDASRRVVQNVVVAVCRCTRVQETCLCVVQTAFQRIFSRR